jgi:hypothetical protein
MKVKTVTRLALCAFTLVFAASYTRPAHALPDNEVTDQYYNGCGTSPTLVGIEEWTCGGGHPHWGTLSGDWLVESIRACDNSSFSSVIMENCNGDWVERSTLGDCQCSH